MKKYTLSIVGIIVQCVGIGLMLFNINSENRVCFWIGFPMVFIGLALAIIQIFLNIKSK
ncbi:hypothetical protein [Flavobacterium faecale]|uniref:hypothetical protein n=1 Tax=Flavobacterium faecale TaxID=1355330 RepID=UPI00131EE3C9|nr:hypothetical protein [Flavobacterium faecale]